MCLLGTVKKIIKVVAFIVLILAAASIGVGLWAVIGGGGPLAAYLVNQSWMGIQIVGGLLIGAGAVLAVDFVLACLNSTKLLSGCCLPLFLIFTLFTTLLFVGVGICCLTFMGDMLRTSLGTAFSFEESHGATFGVGALGSAERDFKCCGSYKCSAANETQYTKYHCSGNCLDQRGCIEAVLADLLVIFSYPMAIGCFAVSGVTCLMFVLSIIMCCL